MADQTALLGDGWVGVAHSAGSGDESDITRLGFSLVVLLHSCVLLATAPQLPPPALAHQQGHSAMPDVGTTGTGDRL